MSDLTDYHSRRDFTQTAEPRGGRAAKRSSRSKQPTTQSYVIQKHAARRLHYDFRLELNGVLLSWAVPKGPSLDPDVKRLAVEVEPHPVEYGEFEGEIAKGQYGAGSVMVWDAGTWQPLDDNPTAAYHKGHLTFALMGHKLKGTWHLVRTARGEKQKSWLLFKGHDEHADPTTDIVATAPNSVVSGLSIEALAARGGTQPSVSENDGSHGHAASSPGRARKPRLGAGDAGSARAPSRGKKAPNKTSSRVSNGASQLSVRLDELSTQPNVTRTPQPASVDVQLATLVEQAPTGEDWLHEIKFDGYRVLVKVTGGEVQLLTRKALDWTKKMPRLARAIGMLSLPDVIIDGEFVALEDNGVSNFQKLQNSLGEDAENLVYYAFDLLHYEQFDLRPLPLVERKALLVELLGRRLPDGPEKKPSAIRVSEHVRGNGAAFYEQACKLGLEGVVSKRAGGTYTGTRSRDWLKIKCGKRQEFVIVGYTEPAGSRAHFGALLVAYYEGPSLVYCGRVGTGFTVASLAALESKLRPLQLEHQQPQELKLKNAPKGAHARGVHWVAPKLVAEVSYLGFTEDGVLRHPTFQGLRDDKKATEVRREVPTPTPVQRDDAAPSVAPATGKGRRKTKPSDSAPQASAPKPIDTSHFKLSNPTKVLYPSVGVTKRELLDYAALVAPRLLPHVVNRPLTLVRCPNGESKQCFFQKHPGVSASGLRAVGIREKEGKADYAVIDDADGLFGLVQLGVLEIHTSGAHADDFEHPDILVFDLDPDPSVGFGEVVRCAFRLKEIFETAELESFVKTTGGKGLHVCIPIEPKLTWPQAKAFTQHVAAALVREEPTRYIATQSKAQRVGKIFIDYLRNGRGATFVAPYSTRARPTAPVAAPLFWDELTEKSRPDQYTVRNMLERLSKLATDPFERMANLRQKLPGNLLGE